MLVNTSFASLSPFYQRLRWQNYGKFFRVFPQADVYRRELGIARLVSNRREWDESLAADWQGIQAARPISLSNSFRQILAATTYKPGPEKPRQPVLLLNSRGDRLVSPNCSEAIQRAWGLELHTHPWAGHDLSLDDGDWVARRLKDWVESL